MIRKHAVIVLSVVLLASLLASCAPAPAASVGEAVFKVTGKIANKNSGDAFVFDENLLKQNSVDMVMDDPWYGQGLKYRGLTLKKMLDLVKAPADSKQLTLTGQDGMKVVVQTADALKWDIVLVHWQDGKPLDQKVGGPTKLAFSQPARANYPDDQWLWWVVQINVE